METVRTAVGSTPGAGENGQSDIAGRASDYGWVLWALAAYFVVQTIVRLILSNSLRVDEAQQFLFGEWLAWGYDTQPPLYNWVQHGVFALFGTSLASLAILKNLLLFLVYVAYYRLARLLLADKGLAVIATLSLLTMPQIFWQAQRDLTHTVGTLLTICLFVYFAAKTLKTPTLTSFLMLGIWAGLGMLTKYNFALVIFATLIAVLQHPDGRKRLFDRRFLVTLAIAALIFLPHGLWMLSNADLAFDRTLHTMSGNVAGSRISNIGKGILDLLVTGFVIAAPTTAVFLAVFRGSLLRSLRAGSEWARFFSTILGVTTTVLVLMIVVITITTFRDRWLLPFLFLLPLYFCLKLEAAGVHSQPVMRKFLIVPIVMMVALPIVIAGNIVLAGTAHRYQHLNTPYGTFIEKVIADAGTKPAAVITTSWHKAGNIRINLPDVPVVSTDFPASDPDMSKIAGLPILLVWSERDGEISEMPGSVSDWVARKLGPQYAHPEQHDIALPYYYGRDPDRYHFGYAWVRAQAQ